MSGIVRLGHYLLRSPYRAGTVVLVLSFLLLLGFAFFSWFAIVLVGLVTLRQGMQSGLIVLVAQALVPVVIGAYDANYMPLVREVVFGSLAVYLLALVLRGSGSWRWVLEYALIVALAVIALVHWAVDDLHELWITQIRLLMSAMSSTPLADNLGTMSDQDVAWFARVATGVLVAWFIVSAVIDLILARWWQAILFNPNGLSRELLFIRLSSITVTLAALCALASMAGIGWAVDMLPVFVAVLSIAGLSFLHYMARLLPRGRLFVLGIFYGVLMLLTPYVIAFVMCLALADAVFDLRAKLLK